MPAAASCGKKAKIAYKDNGHAEPEEDKRDHFSEVVYATIWTRIMIGRACGGTRRILRHLPNMWQRILEFPEQYQDPYTGPVFPRSPSTTRSG